MLDRLGQSGMEQKTLHSGKAKKILKESIFLNAATYFFIAFRFLTGFFVARFLGPSLYGIRSLLGLVIEYQYFSHLGTFDAMRKDVPFYRGKGDTEKAEDIINNVFGINLLYSFFIFALLILTALYMYEMEFETVYVDFFTFLGFYTVCSKIRGFYNVKLAVDKRAHLLSRIKVLEALSYTTACVSLSYFFSLRGLLIGLLLSEITVLIFIHILIREIPSIRVFPGTIWKLLKVGFPIMVISLMFIMLRSIDRIIIAALLSKEMLGFFSVGTMLSGVIHFSTSDVVRTIIAPRMMETLGRTGSIKEIKHYFTEPATVIAYCMPFLIGLIFLGVDFLIHYFLPDYTPAIPVSKILVLSVNFLVLTMMPILVCVSLNKQLNMVLLIFIGILFNTVFVYSFIVMGYGLKGAAAGTGISYFILSLLSLWYALKQFHVKLGEYIRFFALIYVPFLYAFCLLLLIERLFPLKLSHFGADLFVTVWKEILFLIMFSMIFIFVRKNTAFKKLIHSLPIPLFK